MNRSEGGGDERKGGGAGRMTSPQREVHSGVLKAWRRSGEGPAESMRNGHIKGKRGLRGPGVCMQLPDRGCLCETSTLSFISSHGARVHEGTMLAALERGGDGDGTETQPLHSLVVERDRRGGERFAGSTSEPDQLRSRCTQNLRPRGQRRGERRPGDGRSPSVNLFVRPEHLCLPQLPLTSEEGAAQKQRAAGLAPVKREGAVQRFKMLANPRGPVQIAPESGRNGFAPGLDRPQTHALHLASWMHDRA
ncbi:hypothetical protein AAFF_G00305140 [Aldrovandia affinis]|uniref:Uncharacterized protein n=1 Tax=Aldrovandia affinis TaxID=143900 RepID=A0AAD7SPL2_9TELE|nr:hypothetical protein AAFF_G00305140 [Aldrovandia affinis]